MEFYQGIGVGYDVAWKARSIGACNNIHNNYRSIIYQTIPLPEKSRIHASLGDVDSQFIDLNGVTLHYKKVGNGEPTLILLHGFGSSLFTWNKVLYPLSYYFYGNCLRLDRFRADHTSDAGNLGR